MKKAVKMKMRISPIGWLKKNKPYGFTLIEILLVLVILGILSSLLAVRIRGGFTTGDLKHAGRMIIGAISELRGKAAYTRRDQILAFNVDKNYYYPLDPSENQAAASKPIPEKEDNEFIELPPGIELEDVVVLSKGKVQEGEVNIRFFANGCVERSLIHLKNHKDDVYTLEINPITGQVSIQNKYVDWRF
jgi:prepilin-type N-terminal cleavage/methylation domain-containing protein